MNDPTNTQLLQALFDLEKRIVTQIEHMERVRSAGGDLRADQIRLDQLVRWSREIRAKINEKRVPFPSKLDAGDTKAEE